MIKGKEAKKPSFIDQAYALIDKRFKEAENIQDPQYGPGLRPWDHKLWVSIMDLQVSHVNDVMVEEFGKKVSEHYEPIMRVLDSLEKGQKSICMDIALDRKRIAEIERRLDRKRDKIKDLEDSIRILSEEFQIETPVLRKSKRIRRIAFRIALTILLAILLFLGIHKLWL